jgi:outer membrane protein assembly factor BamB
LLLLGLVATAVTMLVLSILPNGLATSTPGAATSETTLPSISTKEVTTPATSISSAWPTYLENVQRTAGAASAALNVTNARQLPSKPTWSFTTGGVVAASPALVGGELYEGSWDGNEYALNASTGKLLWSTFLGVDPSCGQNRGVTSSATVLNGVVYVGGGDGSWYALSATTGSVLWQVYVGNISAGYYNWASPLVHGGYAYVGIASDCDHPLVRGGLLQIQLSTHKIIRTFFTIANGSVGNSIWASPTLDPTTNTLYVATGNPKTTTLTQYSDAIIALNATTLAVKSYSQVPPSEVIVDGDFGATPTLPFNSTTYPIVVSTNKNGVTYAWNRSNLSSGPLWSTRISTGNDTPDGQSVAPAAMGGGRLYLGSAATTIGGKFYYGAIRALNPLNGSILWQRGEHGTIQAASAFANGVLVVPGGTHLDVLNARTGALLWTWVCGAPFFGAPIVVGSTIYAGCTNGTIYAFTLPQSPIGHESTLSLDRPSGPQVSSASFNTWLSVIGTSVSLKDFRPQAWRIDRVGPYPILRS